MIYGYAKQTVDERYGLVELRELSLQFTASDLRRVAAFLHSAADAMDENTLGSSHVHIENFDGCWSADFPDCGIVVLDPSPKPPRTVDLD